MNKKRFVTRAVAGTLAATALVLAAFTAPAQAKNDTGWFVTGNGTTVSSNDTGWF